MTPVRLRLTNFLSYRQESLDLTGFQLAVLVGENGVGKSSLLEAITWALWGKTRAQSDDDIINLGQTRCAVDCVIAVAEHLYRIRRTRERRARAGASTLEFQSEKKHSDRLSADDRWESITEGTIKQTQEKIIKVVGLTYEVFVNSAYLRQGHADEFTTKTPGERKAVLTQILELNRYDRLEERARERGRDLKSQALLLQAQLSIERVDQKIISDRKHVTGDMERQLHKLDQDIAGKKKLVDALGEDRMEVEKLAVQVRTNQAMIAQLESNIVRHKNIIATFSSQLQESVGVVQKLKSVRPELEKLQQSKAKLLRLDTAGRAWQMLSDERSRLEERKTLLNEQVKELREKGICNTCKRPVDTRQENKIRAHLEKEFDQQFGARLKTIIKEQAALQYNPKEHRLLQLSVQKELPKEAQYHDLIRKNDLTLERQKQYALHQRELANVEKQKKDLAAIIERHMKLGKAKRPAYDQWKKEKGILDELELQRRLRWQDLVVKKSAIKQMEERFAEEQRREKELKKISGDLALWEQLVLAFGKKGIQAMLIEHTLPELQEEANRILEKVSGGALHVDFVTQKQKKTGEELIETLEIIIHDALGARAYELYSGGEAFRVNFAIRVALSKLLARRAGTQIRLLVMDEGFGTLDQAGRDDVVGAITAIRDEFDKIIVVTHIQEMKDAFGVQILVTKDATGSHVELVAN